MSEAAAHWDRCKPWIEAALAYDLSGMTIDEVSARLNAGTLQLWPGEKSAAITEVQEFPRAKFLNVFAAGGDLEEIKAMVPSFVSWGRYLGCTKLIVTGREGWARALKSCGFEKVPRVYLSLPITQE